MANDNEALRLRRLVFYAQDVERINAALLAFVKKSGALSCLLIDREGHMVARQGFKQAGGDGASLAALVAGAFAATGQVARLLGEKDFRVLSHQGAESLIHTTLLGERTLQVAVFPASAKPGLVQVLCRELATQLEGLLAEAAERKPAEQPEQKLGADFTDAAKSQLDELFGNL
jgi:predicted regulator of Ras-like GTPase activity (Roadblock/LC7/MglB family)